MNCIWCGKHVVVDLAELDWRNADFGYRADFDYDDCECYSEQDWGDSMEFDHPCGHWRSIAKGESGAVECLDCGKQSG